MHLCYMKNIASMHLYMQNVLFWMCRKYIDNKIYCEVKNSSLLHFVGCVPVMESRILIR